MLLHDHEYLIFFVLRNINSMENENIKIFDVFFILCSHCQPVNYQKLMYQYQ